MEAEFEDGVLYPVRGKSCSTRAMPHLADKFSTFRGFAQASLVEIYEPEKLDGSIELEVNTLESVLLLNEGGWEVFGAETAAAGADFAGVRFGGEGFRW